MHPGGTILICAQSPARRDLRRRGQGPAKKATFGTLRQLFPVQADRWAQQARVNPEDCIAFRMERDGIQAEVVMLKPSTTEIVYRILRCNNVKQMASEKSETLP